MLSEEAKHFPLYEGKEGIGIEDTKTTVKP